jgi:S-adenosylmethionine decarboxylase
MAFNDTLFQLGMDLTRSSTAQKEDFVGSGCVSHDELSGSVAMGDALPTLHTHYVDLLGAKRLESARAVESALVQALELATGEAAKVEMRRLERGSCLKATARLAGATVALEAWPATGYVAVDVASSRGVRPEMLLSALMDAFGAREAMVKRARAANDGARYKKPLAHAPVAKAAATSTRRMERQVRAKRAA